MNRNEFMAALKKQLRHLPKEDREDAIGYYEEYVLDLNVSDEEDITAIVGTPKEVAANILAECTEKHYKEAKKEGHAKSTGVMVWLVILGILASPIAFPVALMILCLLFAVLLMAALIVLTVCVAVLSIFFAGFVALTGVILAGGIVQRIVCLGMGLAFIGVGLLGIVVIVQLVKELSYGIVALFKKVFSSKEGKA